MSSSEAPSTGARRRKAAETEAALRAAALRVFAHRGYLNTKITDITDEAGRAAGSFYNHFTGKEELLEVMLADMLASVDRDVLEGAPGHSPDFTDPAAVRWHVAAFWRFFTANRTVMIALQQAAMVDERFAVRMAELMEPDQRELRDHLGYLTAAGATLPAADDLVASMMSGLLWQCALTWLVTGGLVGRAVGEQEAVDAVSTFISRAIGTRTPDS